MRIYEYCLKRYKFIKIVQIYATTVPLVPVPDALGHIIFAIYEAISKDKSSAGSVALVEMGSQLPNEAESLLL
jgi:hypothetical protein